MENQVNRTVLCYFSMLRQLCSIRRQVPTAVFQSLIVALVLSVLARLPANLIRRLQSVQNAAARLNFGIRRSEHITDALASLHWLRVPERILFKVAVLTYRAVNGSAPDYRPLPIVPICHLTSPGSPTCHLDCGFDHLIPINLWCHPTISIPSAGGPFQSSPPIFEIVARCRVLSDLYCQST